MKWLPFLFLLVFSCKSKTVVNDNPAESKLEEPIETIYEGPVMYNDTVAMPSVSDPFADSGYFKGYIPEEIVSIEENDTTQLFQFLSKAINKKNLVLLNKETLSHSVFINQKTKTRFDTLKNKHVVIISKYNFGRRESQTIAINGFLIKNYTWNGVDSMQEDVYDLYEHSFRHFSFKGKEYYYIRAGAFYSVGTSMGNVIYHLLYSLENKKINYFETCRFGSKLFGDANGDDKLDYLDFDNSDFCTTVPISDSVTIQLYSCNDKGTFVLQKDSKARPYFIKGNTRMASSQDSFIMTNSHWPVPIK